MTVRVYYSTDASAPVLSGTAGSIITLLDACLVNGFGSKIAAGWTKPFVNGSIKAAYKQGLGSNSMYLRVDDTGTGVGFNYGARKCRVAGFNSMTSIDLGTNQFPNEVQCLSHDGVYNGNAGGCWQKSNTADSTARKWVVVATERAFYFWSDMQSGNKGLLHFFGDISSLLPTDAHNTLIICNLHDWGYNNTGTGFTNLNTSMAQSGSLGHFMSRSWTQLGSSINVGKFHDYSKSGQPFPTQIQGKFSLQSLWLTDIYPSNTPSNVVRGCLPGVLLQNNIPAYEVWNRYPGTGNLSGREYLHIPVTTDQNSGFWSVMLEISNTW